MKTYTASEARAMRKEIEKRDKPRKAKAKIEKSEHSKALASAINYFSLFARATEANEYGAVDCKTCGKWMKWKMPDGSCHWGHYMSCGYNATRFSIMNGGTQCKKCNTYREGEHVKMRAYLVKRYGEQEVSLLEIAAVQRRDMSTVELRAIATHYKTEYQKLVKSKGLC